MKQYQNREILEELYWKDQLSLGKIAKQYDVSLQAIWYWMNKFRISSRPHPRNMKVKYSISKELLETLYLKQKLSTEKIAKKLGIKAHSSILTKLMKYSIPRRNLSEIRTKYLKKPFSGNLNEKAYMIGLRAGDLSGENNHKMIRVTTSSTHPAQIEMFKEVFGNYTHAYTYPMTTKHGLEARIYCDLDSSFEFLLKKSENIPDWVLENNEFFYSFLTGYADAEGSWNIMKKGKNAIRFTFRIATTDKVILEQLRDKLRQLGFTVQLYLDRKAGTIKSYGKYNKDLYALWITSKKDIIPLIEKLLPLSHHSEKIRKMKLILDAKDKKWDEIEGQVLNLRKEIKSERINN